jgi:hypothetical protein
MEEQKARYNTFPDEKLKPAPDMGICKHPSQTCAYSTRETAFNWVGLSMGVWTKTCLTCGFSIHELFIRWSK